MNLIEATLNDRIYIEMNINESINNKCANAIVGNFNSRKDLKECEKFALTFSKSYTIKNYIHE